MSTTSMTEPLPLQAASAPVFGRAELGLYALVVFAWSTSWIALSLQLGVVAPEISLVWRFLLSAALVAAWCVLRREPLTGFGAGDHLRFALLGITLFSTNFLLMYHAGLTLVSGLLSVLFALAAPLNVLSQALVLRQPVPGRVAAGTVLGFLGVAALFAPEIGAAGLDGPVIGALFLGVGATLSFCAGNTISSKVQARGLPLLPATAWGMLYGTLWCALLGALQGRPFILDWSVSYLGSLIYLAAISSVVAFASYLTLLRRIGPARAGYATVLFPVFALMISAVFEGYSWTLLSLAGLGLVAAGNALVLTARR